MVLPSWLGLRLSKPTRILRVLLLALRIAYYVNVHSGVHGVPSRTTPIPKLISGSSPKRRSEPAIVRGRMYTVWLILDRDGYVVDTITQQGGGNPPLQRGQRCTVIAQFVNRPIASRDVFMQGEYWLC